ncbi:hypothetical protein ACFX1W_040695 [Malus domestica]
MCLVHDKELPTNPPKGHVMFYTQILEKWGVKLPLHPWLQKMIDLMGYVPRQLSPGEPSFSQWRYCYKMHSAESSTGYDECACWSEKGWAYDRSTKPEHHILTHFQTVVLKKAIKLFGQELADAEKMLRVPKEDRHLGKLLPLFQKYGLQPLLFECQRQASKSYPTFALFFL